MPSIRQQKLLRKLTTKKGRQQEGMFLVEGLKLCTEAQNANLIQELFATQAFLDAQSAKDWQNANVISERDMQSFSQMDTPPQIMAIAKQPVFEADKGSVASIVVLDRINDPGNLGTIIRTANWFGVDQIWCTTGSVDVFNPKTVQASMGAVIHQHVVYQTPQAIDELLSTSSTPIYVAEMSGEAYKLQPRNQPFVLIMGSESHGVDPALSKLGKSVTIEGKGQAESLNVAIATSILLSHLGG